MRIRSLAPPFLIALLLTLTTGLLPPVSLAQDSSDAGPEIIEVPPLGQLLSDLLKDTLAGLFPDDDGAPGHGLPPGPPFTPGTIGDIASNFPKDVGGFNGGCTPNCPGGQASGGPSAGRIAQAVPETGFGLLIAIGGLFVVTLFGAPRRVAQALGLPTSAGSAG